MGTETATSGDPRIPGAGNPYLTAALGLAARGWAVFPCSPETKAPLVEGDRDESGALIPNTGGVKKASVDPVQIARWWKKHPKAMIGLACGDAAGFWVIDIENGPDKATGEIHVAADILERLRVESGGTLPPTFTVRTGSGGLHLYFRMVPGQSVKNWVKFTPGCDVRTTGGYVIAAPSVRADGTAYAVVDDAEIAEPSPELLAAIPRLLAARKAADRALKEAAAKARAGGAGNGARVTKPTPGPSLDRGGEKVGEAVRKYALSALDAEVRAVETAPAGQRNAQLNESALKIGSLVAAGALSGAVALASLRAAAAGNPGKDDAGQLEATIQSGYQAGLASPRDLSDVGQRTGGRSAGPPRDAAPAPPAADTPPEGGEAAPSPSDFDSGASGPLADPPSDEEPEEEAPSHWEAGDDGQLLKGKALHEWCGWRPLTDLGNAERFRARYGRDYRYTVAGGWLCWDGQRWEPHHHGKPPGALMLAVHACVRSIRDEADAVNSKRRRLALLQWARKSEAAGKINAIVGLFQSMVTVREDIFDLGELLFNVQNGTLSIERDDILGWHTVLRPHRREDLITKISPVAYDPVATCVGYDGFMAAMQPDPDIRAFLHRWAGLSLSALKIQKLVQNYGTGGNGKGVMTELHAYVAGDYAGTMNIESLLAMNQRSGQGSSPDIAKLPGIRMLRVSEPEDGATLAEALVKRMTGGDPIDARHNYGPFFTFKPVFKLSFQGNHKLKIRGTDNGIWRRMRLVKWDVTVADDKADVGLGERLKGEAAGILNRLLAGLIQYLESGLAEPEAVREATASYRDDSDPVGQFLSFCTEPDPGNKVGARALHGVYAAWAKWTGNVDQAGRPYSEKALKPKLETANVRWIKSGSVWWMDIKLVKAEGDFVDQDGHALPVPDAPDLADDRHGAAPPAPQPVQPSPPVWEGEGDVGRDAWEGGWK